MQLPKKAVNRPITTLMVFLAILLFGVVAITRSPLDVLPEMELPTLTVITSYPGASPSEVEENVTKPIEENLAVAEGLDKLTSTSKQNVSFVKLQYEWGKDLTEAGNNIRDLLELAEQDLPEDANAPIIYKINTSMMPTQIYTVSADESFSHIQQILENRVLNQLKKTQGVGAVLSLGAPERQVQVKLVPEKLKAYNITSQKIASVLQAGNITIPGGTIESGSKDFAVKIPGEFDNLKQLRQTVLKNHQGEIVRVKDVARVDNGFEEQSAYVNSKSGQSVLLMVQKQSGGNTVGVVERVRQKMSEIRADLPADVEINEIVANDELVLGSLNNLSTTIIYAWIIVVLVVFFFLHRWRGSLIVFLTIPFSIIVAFIAMYLLGWSINIFTLVAVIIALGMVVDNSIVVFENITTHIERGSRPKQAAIFGTGEMGQAITASTTTTVAVFLPMVFMGGIAGILFKQLALLVAVTIITSLITALSLTPAISAKILNSIEERKENLKIHKIIEKIIGSLSNYYRKLIKSSVKHPVVVFVVVIILFIVTLFVGRTLYTSYIPQFDAGDLMVTFNTEAGTQPEETQKVAQKIKSIIEKEVPEKVPGSMASISGQTEEGLLSSVGMAEGKNVGTVMAHLVKCDQRERSAKDIGQDIRKEIRGIPGIVSFNIKAGSYMQSSIRGDVKPIEVEVSGSDFTRMDQVTQKLERKMENIVGLTDINTTADEGKLEVHININRDKAAAMALNIGMIGKQIRNSIYGVDAGDYTESGEDYQIRVRYARKNRIGLQKVNNIQLKNLKGEQIKLAAIADINIRMGRQKINRKSQMRIIKITSGLKEGVALGKAAQEVRDVISDIDTPEGVSVKLAGQVKEKQESFTDLYLILGLGIALVYMVMASQFESFKHPFIIMFALPLTLIGIIWALKITSTALSLNSFIGAIMLIGIVVNNGIVLVNYVNLLRERDNSLQEAVIEGATSRLRPILMTSFTTMLAMLPMALSKGMGHEMFVPIAITMIGGMLVATLITLVFVPTLYFVMERNK